MAVAVVGAAVVLECKDAVLCQENVEYVLCSRQVGMWLDGQGKSHLACGLVE